MSEKPILREHGGRRARVPEFGGSPAGAPWISDARPEWQLPLPGFPSLNSRDAFRRRLEGVLVGKHPLMREARERILRLALQDHPVLIEGESGTGKDLAASAIHEGSRRAGREMRVGVLSGLGDTARSVLLGHAKGAFTSAWCDHAGLFVQADGSTLFLDDVVEAPKEVQPILLRAIEKQRVQPLGSEVEIEVDTRVIASTNRSLDQAVKEGVFRQDLYFRLKVHRLSLPPLRAHLDDLELLAGHFLAKIAGPGRPPKHLDRKALDLLHGHAWEGNVRELENLMTAAAAEAEGDCLSADVIKSELEPSPLGLLSPAEATSEDAVHLHEVRHVLAQCDGNKRETARRLKISPKTLYKLLDQSGSVESQGNT